MQGRVGWVMQGWGEVWWDGVGEIIDVTPTRTRCRIMPIVVV